MRKEWSLLMAQHIENAAFQHWQSVHGSYANNTVIDGPINERKTKVNSWVLQHSMEPATDVVIRAPKKLSIM